MNAITPISPRVATPHRFSRMARRAFTLIELLVTIVIMLILASMVLFALANAQTTAKDAKTRATISKINTFIMAKYESYATRRVPIKVAANTGPRDAALLRLNALRELMRLEMPDRHVDITDAPTIVTKPSISNAYFRRFNSSSKDVQYESAECLYLIIAFGLEDQEALASFSESEIGDTDGDGLKEFIDGWGKPIAFLRWAPKLPSLVQYPQGPAVIPDATVHHDPFDIMQRQDGAFAIYPLIYSAGPDQIFDIQTERPKGSFSFKPDDPYNGPAGLPQDLPSTFSTTADGVENWHDNITNHELLGP